MKGSGKRFILGVTAISSGTAVGQLLLLVSSPLLARLYSPEDFAVLTVVTSIAIPMAMAITLRFESAVPLVEEAQLGRALAQLAMGLSLSICTLLTLAIWLISVMSPGLLTLIPVGNWAYAIPLLAFTLAAYRIGLQWAVRRQAYRSIGIRNVLHSSSTVAAQIGGGLRSLGPQGLVGGYVIGQGIGVILLVSGTRLFERVQRAQFKTAILRYWKFALTLTPAGTANSLGVYMPAIFITALYGPIAGGSYGLAQRVLAGPITLLGQAIAQVYLAEVANSRRRGNVETREMFDKVSLVLALAATVLALIVGFGSPLIFEIAFGGEWEEAGKIAQVLSVQLGAQLIAGPLSQTLIAFERAGVQLTWDLLRLLIVAGAFFVSWIRDADLLSALLLYSVGSTMMYALSWFLSRRIVYAGAK